MPKLVVEEVKEFGVLPIDTRIRVRVESMAVREVAGRDGKEGFTKLEFKFIILEIPDVLMQSEEYAELIGSPIWGSVSMRLTQHPDNKLRRWAEVLLNMGELGAGFELDTDMLEGRTARAVIQHYTRKDGTSTKHQVGALLEDAAVGGGVVPPALSLVETPTIVAPPAQSAMASVGASDNPWPDDPPF